MSAITSKDFISAFKKEWDKEIKIKSEEILEKFKDTREWTDFMLSNKRFLNQIMRRIPYQDSELIYWKEFYTIDAVYVSGEDLLGRKELSYPKGLQVIIEHENGDHPEEEMWKLLYWRSPLKVLIFYDYHEYQKKQDEKKKTWLKERLEKFTKMLINVETFFKENVSTEYLFIIGNQEIVGGTINWRAAYMKPSNTKLELEKIY